VHVVVRYRSGGNEIGALLQDGKIRTKCPFLSVVVKIKNTDKGPPPRVAVPCER